MRHLKWTVFRSVMLAVCCIPVSTTASAQERPDSGKPTAEADTDSGQIADIIVTAQRREQSLQQVPIAITAVTGDTLVARGVTNLTGLSALSPGLNLTLQSGTPRVFIRGVGGPAANGIDPSTAIFVDDVYQGGQGNLWHLDDVSRIEVLKGPQGTLFGRNATAGVIQIFTRAPTQELHVQAKAGYESFDTYYGSAYVSGGLTDNLAVSVSAQGRKQNDGWNRNVTLNKDLSLGKSYTLRGKLLWTPGEDTSILLGGEVSYADYNHGVDYATIKGTISQGGGVFQPNYGVGSNVLGVNKRPQHYVYLKAEHDFGPVELISISAYRSSKIRYIGDLDGGPAPIILGAFRENLKAYTQEVRLQSGRGSTLFGRDFSWIVGGFYLNSKDAAVLDLSGAFLAFLPLPPGLTVSQLSTFGRQKTDSLSFFGDATLEILPKTELSIGARYNHDKLDIYATNTNTTNVGNLFTVTPNADPSITFKEVSYRAVLNHKFSDDVLAYASYSRGYKPGGYGLLAPTAAPVKPEVIRAWEAGVKTTLFDRKLLLNAAAFSYRYSNLQVNVFGSNNTIQTINAASARIRGFEANLEARPNRNLSITAGVSLLDGKYRNFNNGPTYVPLPAACGALPPYPAPTGGFAACPADLSGNKLVNAPNYQVELGATYSVPVGDGTLDLTANYSLTDKFFWYPDNDSKVQQPRVGLINASIAWNLPGDRVRIQAYVRNATNKTRPLSVNEGTASFGAAIAEPRVVGAFVQYSF